MNQIKAFLKNEEGSETLKYVVIVAAIARCQPRTG